MKSSRAMLLAAILFAAPVFASETPKADGTTVEATPAAIETKSVAIEPAKDTTAKVETTPAAANSNAAPTADATKEETKSVATEPAKDTTATPAATNPNTAPTADATKEEKLGYLAAAYATMVAASDYTLLPVANWTFLPVLTRLPYIKNSTHLPLIGKTMVAATAAAALAYGYSVATAEDTNDDDIFAPENN
jgi:hypothetical protein